MRITHLLVFFFVVLLGSLLALSAPADARGVKTVATTLTRPLPLSPGLPATRAALMAMRVPVVEASEKAGSRTALVSSALGALSGQVAEQSHPDALRLAFQAYYSFKAAHPEQVRKPYLYFVDYGLDNRTPRGYVFDMQSLRVVDGPFMVAHGRGSSSGGDGVPTRFSNSPGSASTSLGLFVAQETYSFSGHSNGSLYHSIGLRLRGVSGRFNSTAYSRGVVVHGAPYVTPVRAGRSEGCPAMEPSRAERLIPQISGGGLVFLFSPVDRSWMEQDPWARGGASQVAMGD